MCAVIPKSAVGSLDKILLANAWPATGGRKQPDYPGKSIYFNGFINLHFKWRGGILVPSHTLIFPFLVHQAWPPTAAPDRLVSSTAPSRVWQPFAEF